MILTLKADSAIIFFNIKKFKLHSLDAAAAIWKNQSGLKLGNEIIN